MNTFFFTALLLVIPLLAVLARRRTSSKRVPPGSMGFPIIGQSLSLLRAMRANTAEQWIQQRIEKYGPVSKLSLFGKPTVFIHGQAANKFVFTASTTTLSNQQPMSMRKILGDKNLLELSGDDHKRVRNALTMFLKPESLKRFVGKMDEEIRNSLGTHWEGKQQVTVLPIMKNMTFNIICSLLFGIERGAKRERFLDIFQTIIEGVWSVPINLPLTRYNRSLRATSRVRKMMRELISEKRIELQNGAPPHQDLITCLLSVRNEENKEAISEDEILHNATLTMIAGHDTSSVVLTFMIRLLATRPDIHAHVVQEQEVIANNKLPGEFLTWEDLSKMKYTWAVAMEVLRVIPPVFGGFRLAVKDIEYSGFTIPKGWQVFWLTSITQMDENIFPDPTKFDPNRFDNQKATPPFCFIPFGGGPRICPGMEFARIEILVSMHYLVTRFTWKLLADLSFSRDPMPVPSKGLPIELSPRQLKQ